VRILIAEDNEDLRNTMQILLADAGYEVELAPNGARALEAQRSRPADVLITDIVMPEMDGLEAIMAFRSEFRKMKIIALSGGGGSEKGGLYLSASRGAGADAVLPKPFEMEQLLEILRGWQKRKSRFW
jgi:CheY-like chemotaxis protein